MPAARRPLRPRARSGPCDGGQPRWRDQRACACADGSRASWRGDGCSAGRCACSRGSPLLAGRTAHADPIPSPIEWFNCRLLLLATAIGKPMDRRHPSRRAPRACERGRRHARSTIRERRKGGQTGSSRSGVGKPSIIGRPEPSASRHAERSHFLGGGGCQPHAELLGCHSHDCPAVPPPPSCTGCGQSCGKRPHPRRRDERLDPGLCSGSGVRHRAGATEQSGTG